ncbi:hypothetical protein NLJ89_g9931 [Agrocybe chaxingu]|uniref:F-box domain-containing protein n=1 Tax=Agrocybe chaxingu TaxID=84603 RepID=A0A9W8JRR1_9AGAR|nr:hypothetical protein NLJ89_g9931 [Agrocybe chaxingu]
MQLSSIQSYSTVAETALSEAAVMNVLAGMLRHPDLACMALVSRQVLTGAIAPIWGVLPSSLPLLKLLPGLTLKQGKWCIPYVITEPDRRRFDFYAPFIRQIVCLLEDGSRKIDVTIFYNLAASMMGHILPNLQTLGLPHTLFPSAFPRVPFFSPSLTTVHAVLPSYAYFLLAAFNGLPNCPLSPVDYLERLADQCPRLQSLSLTGDIPRNCISYLLPMQNLCSLELDFCLQRPTVRLHRLLLRIPDFPNLSTLILLLPPKYKVRPLPARTLQSICRIEVEGDIEPLVTILASTYHLKDAIIRSHSAAMGGWKKCMGMVVRTSASTLETLTVHAECRIHFGWVFNYLYKAPHIKNLDISAPCIHISDDDIRAVVTTWPHLEQFITPLQANSSTSLTLRSIDNLEDLSSLRFLQLQLATHGIVWSSSAHHSLASVVDHLFGLN